MIERIQSVVARVAHCVDSKRWTELRALFGDEVEVDYTALFGGAVQRQTGDELIDGWRRALAKVATQHLLGPIDVRIDSDRATAECHVLAHHFAKSEDSWVVGGHYEFGLALVAHAFRITRMKLTVHFQSGNQSLLAEVSE